VGEVRAGIQASDFYVSGQNICIVHSVGLCETSHSKTCMKYTTPGFVNDKQLSPNNF